MSVQAETIARRAAAQRQARVATMQNIAKKKAEETKKWGSKTADELEGNTLGSTVEVGRTWA